MDLSAAAPEKVLSQNRKKEASRMRLVKLDIRNYRSCIHTKIAPNPRLTALIGVNGSGKSNMLSAVLLLKKLGRVLHGYSRIDNPYVKGSRINAELEYRGKHIKMRGDVYYETNERNVDEVLSATLKWNLRQITGEDSWVELPTAFLSGEQPRVFLSRSQRYIYSYSKEYVISRLRTGKEVRGLLSPEMMSALANVGRYFADISYYSASQFSDPTRCPVSIEIEEGRLVARRRFDRIDHTQFMYDLYSSWKNKKVGYTRFINAVGNSGIGIIENIQFNEKRIPTSSVQVRAGGKMIKQKHEKVLVAPLFRINRNKLSPNQLSEGTFKTLALLFYLLTDKGRLLLIEEPEVCIHHGLLDSVVSLIKSESRHKQIIISTHSDYVLDQMEPENVMLVRRHAQQGTRIKPMTKALSADDFRALKSYLQDSGNLGEYWREGGLADASR